MTRHRQPNGFTLVELVMVMLLVGIMANIVIPLIRPEKFRLDSAVVEVGSTFTAQQRNAVLRQHDIVLQVDTAQKWFRVHYDIDNDGEFETGEQWHVVELPDGVTFGRGGAPARPLGNGPVSLTQEQDDLPALTYHRNGSASEEAIIYLTSDRGAITNSYAEDARAIEIERATGRVTCYSYSTGQWVRTC